RRAATKIWRSESASQPAGALPANVGAKTGHAGGRLHGSQPGNDRGTAGRDESRRGIRADGSCLSTGPVAVHARGQQAGGAVDTKPPSLVVPGNQRGLESH